MTNAETLLYGNKAYVEHFNRMEYPAQFQRCCNTCSPVFASLTEESAATLAEELLSLAESRLPRGRFRRRLALSDLQQYFLLYIVPAALAEETEAAAHFAGELCARWNAAHPDFPFQQSSFSALCEGFRDKPFGL
ncbi:MAG: hypothetical protein E7472_01430 [Ruminococcaceae bacterium]|nr:hypothetical protein [Oscillospiraceae bacterium]